MTAETSGQTGAGGPGACVCGRSTWLRFNPPEEVTAEDGRVYRVGTHTLVHIDDGSPVCEGHREPAAEMLAAVMRSSLIAAADLAPLGTNWLAIP